MKKVLVLISFTALLMIAVVGCGDDDTITDNPMIIGDTTSEDFQFVDENVGENSLDNIGSSLDLSFSLLDSIPEPAPGSKYESPFRNASSDLSVISIGSYVYENGWHIFTFEATFVDNEDSTYVSGTDSLQLLEGTTPLQYVDSTMDGLRIRKHFDVENDYVDGHGDHSLDIDATSMEVDSTGTINGSALETLEVFFADSNAVCTLNAANSITINDIVLNLENDEDCPRSGTVILGAALMLDCTGTGGLNSLSIDGAWTLTAVFNGTTTVLTYTDNVTTWTITEDCGSSSTISEPLDGIVLRD